MKAKAPAPEAPRRGRPAVAGASVLPGHKLWAFGLGSALLLAVLACYFLFESLLPFFLAFGLAYAFGPLVDLGEKKGLSRAAGALLLIGLLAALAAVLVGVFLPILMVESRQFAETFPGQVTELVGKVAAYANGQGMDLPVNQELAGRMGAWTHEIFSSAVASGFGTSGRIYSSLSGVMGIGIGLLIVPVFFFYLLRDLPAFKLRAIGLIPPRHQPAVSSGLSKVDGVFSSYIRGQLTVALILAAVFSAALALMGVRYGLVIGIFAGFLNLVPYLGQALGALAATLMALVDFSSWGRVIAVPALFSAVNFIEGTFITPGIVGNKVGLSSMQTLVALFVGADVGGLAGMAVAIPLAASFKVLILDMFKEYKRSDFYSRVSAP